MRREKDLQTGETSNQWRNAAIAAAVIVSAAELAFFSGHKGRRQAAANERYAKIKNGEKKRDGSKPKSTNPQERPPRGTRGASKTVLRKREREKRREGRIS